MATMHRILVTQPRNLRIWHETYAGFEPPQNAVDESSHRQGIHGIYMEYTWNIQGWSRLYIQFNICSGSSHSSTTAWPWPTEWHFERAWLMAYDTCWDLRQNRQKNRNSRMSSTTISYLGDCKHIGNTLDIYVLDCIRTYYIFNMYIATLQDTANIHCPRSKISASPASP